MADADTADGTGRAAARLEDLRRLRRRLLLGGGVLITVLVMLATVVSSVADVEEFHARERQSFGEARAAVDYFLFQRDRAYATSINGNDVLWRDQRPALQHVGTPLAERFHGQGDEVVVRAQGRTAVPWLVLGARDNPLPEAELRAYLGMVDIYSAYTADSITAQDAGGPVLMYAYEPQGRLVAVANVRDEAQLLQMLGVPTRRQAFARLLSDEPQIRKLAPRPGPIRAASREGRLLSHYGTNPLTGQPALIGMVTMAEGTTPYFRRVVFESIDNIRARLQSREQGRYLVASSNQQVVFSTGGLSAQDQAILLGTLGGTAASQPKREHVQGRFILTCSLPGVNWTLSHVYDWGDIWRSQGYYLLARWLSALLIIGLLWWLLRRIDRRVFTPALADASRVYESEALSRVIIGTAPIGLALLARDSGAALLQNEAARHLVGGAAGASPQHEGITPLYARLVELGRNAADDEIVELQWSPEQGGAGSQLQVSLSRATYHDQPVWVCAMRDVTAQRELEDNLRRAREDSESARHSAEAANRAKSAFVATMSHEIRTPLNGVLGHLELLARSPLQAGQRERLDRIRFSADALMRIISDVLDFSKIEAGQLDVEPAPFALRPLIESVALLYAPDALRKNVRLYYAVDAPADQQCIGDAHRIRQILNNLVSNAVKFTESGRILLRAELQPGEAGSVLRVQVIDSGIGMNAEQAAQLFQPFQQADASVSRRFGGSGLGLALCQQLAQAMGGQVAVDSTEGVGSSFTLTLPVRLQAAPPATAPLAGQQVTVLSTTPEWRAEMTRLLLAWGAEVTALDRPNADDSGDLLLIVGDHRAWSEDEEQQLQALHRRTVLAHAQGPLTPEQHGTRVEVTCYASDALLLALEGDGAPAIARAITPATPTQSRGTVLLVEDNAVNRELIQQQLEELGYAVEAAEDGQAALALWRDNAFMAVLTDINMPVMDGYALARELRARGQSLPILAITATALASERERCLAAGIDDLLLKPLNLERLQAGLSRVRPVAPPGQQATAAAVPAGPRKVSAAIRRLFVETGDTDLTAIAEARGDNDVQRLLDRVHAFKGVLQMLGERELGAQCGEVEQRLREGSTVDPAMLDALQSALEACLQAYREGLERES